MINKIFIKKIYLDMMYMILYYHILRYHMYHMIHISYIILKFITYLFEREKVTETNPQRKEGTRE